MDGEIVRPLLKYKFSFRENDGINIRIFNTKFFQKFPETFLQHCPLYKTGGHFNIYVKKCILKHVGKPESIDGIVHLRSKPPLACTFYTQVSA